MGEEALSRVEQLHYTLVPRRLTSTSASISSGSDGHPGNLLSAALDTLFQAVLVHTSIRALVNTVMTLNPLTAAHGAGSALHSTVKKEAKALAASQARLYGFDKIAVLVTSGSSGSSSGSGSGGGKVVVGLDVLEKEVMWTLELPAITSRSGEKNKEKEEVEKDKTVQVDAATIALISNLPEGVLTIQIDIETGVIKHAHAHGRGHTILPGYKVKGIFCTETKLASTTGITVSGTTTTTTNSSRVVVAARTHLLLLSTHYSWYRPLPLTREELEGSPVPFPYSSDGSSSDDHIGGMYMSRIAEGSGAGASASTFESARVLLILTLSAFLLAPPLLLVVAVALLVMSGVPLHDVEALATTIFNHEERIVSIAYQHPDDAINTRATTLRDDSVLMKCPKPQLPWWC